MSASGSSITPPLSGAATSARSPGSSSTSTHAERSSSRSTHGRVRALMRSSRWRTSRALRPARSAARTASCGVSRPSTSGRPAFSACGEVGRSSSWARIARQSSSGSSVSAWPAGKGQASGSAGPPATGCRSAPVATVRGSSAPVRSESGAGCAGASASCSACRMDLAIARVLGSAGKRRSASLSRISPSDRSPRCAFGKD